MKRKTFLLATTLLAVPALILSGCKTYGESAALSGAGGAGVGAIIGHQSGHQGEGAIIGAVLGAVTGLVAHDIKARRTQDSRATAGRYGYDPQLGEMLQLEDAQVYPRLVKPGNMAEATVQYALLGVPGRGVDVRETRTLRRGEEVIAELSSKTFKRTEGTWVSTLPFRVSEDLEPGEYTMTQVVQTAQSRISSNTRFSIGWEYQRY